MLGALVLATAVLVYINVVHSTYKKALNLGNNSIMSLEDSTYSFGKSDGYIIAGGQEGITAINKNGEIAWKFSCNASDPHISCAGKYVLYADLSGSEVYLVSEGNQISSYKSTYEIINAHVNENGYYTVLSKERGYKSLVLVLSPSGEQIYAWHSTKYNVLDAVVSSDNKSMFVSALNFGNSGEKFCGTFYFQFDKTEPEEIDCGENNLVSGFTQNASGVIAIGDSAVMGFGNNGKRQFSIDFDGRTLEEYAMGENSFVLGLTQGSVEGNYGGSAIEIYSYGGNMKGSFKIDDEVKFLDIDDTKILVNSDEGAYILTDSGRVSGNLSFENDVREGLIFAGGKKLMLVNGSSVNVYDAK